MSEFAVSSPRKFLSFRHLGFESAAHKFAEERKSEIPQNVDEVHLVEVGETSNSPAKVMSVSQNVPVTSEVVM